MSLPKSGLYMRYFVMNPHKKDKWGKASRIGIMNYAFSLSKTDPVLHNELTKWITDIRKILRVTV